MGIVDRVIYAGKTPLFSDFVVTQSGPMQLEISGGEFQITGQAKHFDPSDVPPEFFSDGRAEMDDEGKARVWLQDKVTKQLKDKSKRRRIAETTTVNITADLSKTKSYRIDLRSPSDIEMLIQTQSWLDGERAPATEDLTHTLVFPFKVPVGTTNLNDLKIEVFKVLPGRQPAPLPWEK
jgi:hypothetical protein